MNQLVTELTMFILNSLAPGNFEYNFRHVVFKQILVIDGWGICCEIALIWMSLDFTDDQSTLVQVMAWCRQATSHYLSQWWPRSLSPYVVTRPQWIEHSHNLSRYNTMLYIAVQWLKQTKIVPTWNSQMTHLISNCGMMTSSHGNIFCITGPC